MLTDRDPAEIALRILENDGITPDQTPATRNHQMDWLSRLYYAELNAALYSVLDKKQQHAVGLRGSVKVGKGKKSGVWKRREDYEWLMGADAPITIYQVCQYLGLDVDYLQWNVRRKVASPITAMSRPETEVENGRQE